MKLNIPIKGNKKLERILQRILKNKRLGTFLECSNITAIDRLNLSDHGSTHVAIVSNIALKLLRNLMNAGISTSIEKNYSMVKEDAEVVVVLAALLHDLGHSVHRDDHTNFSVPLAVWLLPDL